MRNITPYIILQKTISITKNRGVAELQIWIISNSILDNFEKKNKKIKTIKFSKVVISRTIFLFQKYKQSELMLKLSAFSHSQCTTLRDKDVKAHQCPNWTK